MQSPRSTAELLSETAEHGRKIQPALEYFQLLEKTSFHEGLREGLETTSIPAGKIDEIVWCVQQQIRAITDGLEKAAYQMRELAGEMANASDLANRSATPQSRFKI